MKTFHLPNRFDHGPHVSKLPGRIGLSYQQIAVIIAKRDGDAITPAHVQQICRIAEAKLARALLTDAFTATRPPMDTITYRAMHFGDVDDESPKLRNTV